MRWVGLYAVYVAPAIVTTWLAARQARNAAMWLLGALLFPIVVPLILVALLAVRQDPVPRPVDQGPDLRRGL